MNALWESVDVLHALRYGDAELITNDDKLLDMLIVMTDEVKSQIGLAEHMSEVLASGLEVMQTIYNNQLQMLTPFLLGNHLSDCNRNGCSRSEYSSYYIRKLSFKYGARGHVVVYYLLVVSTIVATYLICGG